MLYLPKIIEVAPKKVGYNCGKSIGIKENTYVETHSTTKKMHPN